MILYHLLVKIVVEYVNLPNCYLFTDSVRCSYKGGRYLIYPKEDPPLSLNLI